MANPWFRFYGGEFLNDEKIWSLDGNERSVWITLLCLASQKGGVVSFVSEQSLIQRSGIKNWKRYEGVLSKFAQRGMVTLDNGNVTVCNWAKRQYSPEYARVLKHRQKNDTEMIRKGNANDTPYTDTDTESDTEKKNPKGQALEFVNALFKGFKDSGIEIQDAAGERSKYPSLFRRKNPDVNYWIAVARYSQTFNFRPKEGQDYVFPWHGPVKLSKLYYEVRKKYEEQKSGADGMKKLSEMKKVVMKGMNS